MIRFVTLFIGIMLLTTRVVNASIKVTEIAWMGTAESQFGEWLELYNDGAEDVDLSGWKLYESGGDQLVFTFTKNISANNYLLVERTTATSSDPVPGINDESGPFSGGGLSNSGEHLVLKDSSGSVVEDLDFSSGWPAGDVETKNTMSWDGTNWITAVPTPKAPTTKVITGGGGGSPESVHPAEIAPKLKPEIKFNLPNKIYTNVSSEYSAKTFLESGEAYNGLFLWNMGDGTIYKSEKPVAIKHTYKYPGTYTISFAYYRYSYDKKPFLFNSIEKSVNDIELKFEVVDGQGFRFTNNDSVPMDISGWLIVLPDKIIELPLFSILAPKKTLIMPFSSFNLMQSYNKGYLETPETVQIIDNNKSSEVLSNQVIAKKYTSYEASNPNKRLLEDQKQIEQQNIVEESKSTEKKAKVNKNFIFIGVLSLVVLLFVLVEYRALQKNQP